MSPLVYYLILIDLHAGMADALRRYEHEAAPVMERHGGRFVQVLRPVHAAVGGVPDEVHLLAFDSEQGFADFRADPALHDARRLRDAAVKRVSVLPLHAIALDEYLALPDR